MPISGSFSTTDLLYDMFVHWNFDRLNGLYFFGARISVRLKKVNCGRVEFLFVPNNRIERIQEGGLKPSLTG